MADLPDDIARINALTSNARNTWFALLGVLVFVGITLMGVEHIDFYGVGRATELPLVNVDVPTRYFFVAAPILTAAIYGYFHLYLIRLWDVLGKADPVHQGQPLGDVVSPWLVTDAALHLRRRLRDDACTTPRTLEAAAMALNFLLAWGFGPLVLGLLWWQSMPAREFLWITLVATLALIVVLITGTASLAMLILRMRPSNSGQQINLWSTVPAMSAFLIIAPALLIFAFQRTEGPTEYLADLVLIGEDIVERPEGWLPYAIARDEFRDNWCRRKGIKAADCLDLGDREQSFKDEWRSRRSSSFADFQRPSWDGPFQKKPDLRNAVLISAYLVGANLSLIDLAGSEFWDANLEGADLSKANLSFTDFRNAELATASLRSTNILHASFVRTNLVDTHITFAKIESTVFWYANLTRTSFNNSQITNTTFFDTSLNSVDFSSSGMKEVNFGDVTLTSANFKFSYLDDVSFGHAKMANTVFDFSYLAGSLDTPTFFAEINLDGATNFGGAMRNLIVDKIDFDERTDFRNAFLDKSVSFSPDFAAQMGTPLNRPCQWVTTHLSDEEYFSLWRWWIERSPELIYWDQIAPPEWRNVPRLTPEDIAELGLTDCTWKTGPMPGAEASE
ncbi:pentapeptide repeat-containing protein [Roseovarius faecimaris]|nr:pentapeptide repeat-containing protein [Roseovarius faecimaris]